MNLRRFTAVILVLFFTVLPLKAQGIASFFRDLEWSARFNVLFFLEDNGNKSAPMPILPSPGGGASFSVSDLLAFEVSLDFYGTTYDYEYSLKRAVPSKDEFRSAFVIGSILSFQPVFRFRPKEEKFTIRAYGGLSLDLRIIFRAYGIPDSDPHTNDGINYTGFTVGEARNELSSYFWGNGRFIFPFIGGGMDFPLMDGIQLGFDLRLWLPVWRIWSDENLPLREGFRFGLGFRVTFI